MPPATPAEARAVYALLHITPAMVRLERTYAELYFASIFLHLVVRLLFLSIGMSVLFRRYSDAASDRLAKAAILQRAGTASLALIKKPLDRLGLLRNARRAVSTGFLGQKMATLRRSWQPHLVRSAFLYYLLYTVFFSALCSPITYYEDFLLPHRYGLSHEPFSGWLSDTIKDSSVDGLVGGVLAAMIIWGISIYPKRWATVFALWACPIIFLSIFLDPLFDRIDNRFTALPVSSPLYSPLHTLAAKVGVPKVLILVADKSKQTDETNAYVTGLGSTAQIVLWDTLIKKMPTDEIVAITGHELGHYVEHHVIIGGAVGAFSMFLFLPVLRYLAELLLDWFGPHWKISSLGDPAALPVLIISLSILTFAVSPVTNYVSRIIEHRADSFGLAVTGNRLAMATALVDLANENLSDPYPPRWEVFWLEDHPPFGERIRFALYGQPITRHFSH